ncbi:unnamed protein product, partial [Closterium sp. NIES-53]
FQCACVSRPPATSPLFSPTSSPTWAATLPSLPRSTRPCLGVQCRKEHRRWMMRGTWWGQAAWRCMHGT